MYEIGLSEAAATQLLDYLSASLAALGCLPTQDAVVLERFFDEAGGMQLVCCDLTQPSPLALEALSARPYAYLDNAPLEERRTQAVMARRWRAPDSADEIGQLDPQAIARVRGEAWPDPQNGEELHDALLWLGCLSGDEADAGPSWHAWLAALAGERRVMRLATPRATLWVAAERLRQCLALWPEARVEPDVAPLPDPRDWSRGEALVELLRSRLEGLGPGTVESLAEPLGLDAAAVAAALTTLEVEGFALRGRFTPGGNAEEWCDRRLLARVHHYTIRRLRAEIEPVAARDFLRFLFEWQHLSQEARLEGPDAVPVAATLLEGFEAPAGAWETEILPARIAGYEPSWLDDMAGRITWRRLTLAARSGGERPAALVRATPIALLARQHAGIWHALAGIVAETPPLHSGAQAVLDSLRTHGAPRRRGQVPQPPSGAPKAQDLTAEIAVAAPSKVPSVTRDASADSPEQGHRPASPLHRESTPT
jgi:ATP-dependent Lhr-like helicase